MAYSALTSNKHNFPVRLRIAFALEKGERRAYPTGQDKLLDRIYIAYVIIDGHVLGCGRMDAGYKFLD